MIDREEEKQKQMANIKFQGKTRGDRCQDGILIQGYLVYDSVRDSAVIWTKDLESKNDPYVHAVGYIVDPDTVTPSDPVVVHAGEMLEEFKASNNRLISLVISGMLDQTTKRNIEKQIGYNKALINKIKGVSK